MAKVFGIHTITLLPGVTEEDFERFMLKEYLPAALIGPGWQAHLLKGDRGEHTGQYILLLEIDSVEVRNRYYPAEGQMSEEAQAIVQGLASEAQAALGKISAYTGENDIHTDYVEVTG